MSTLIELLQQDHVQEFIRSHENTDVGKLLLKQKTLHGVPMEWIARQIEGRKRARTKLPLWYSTKGIIFPRALALEQCSSQATAAFKSQLLRDLTGIAPEKGEVSGADLTGGFGVDTLFLSKTASHIDYVEPDPELLDIARHNHKILSVNNIRYSNASAEGFLLTLEKDLDFIFLDPSRRKNTHKVFKLSDSVPNTVEIQDTLLERAAHVILKASPMMDLRQGIKELQNVSQIVVLSVENECKEVLFIIKRNFSEAPSIRAVELHKSGEVLNSLVFTLAEEKSASIEFSSPMEYLYEPNAAILKAGAFKFIGDRSNLKKLAPDTHLYTAQDISHNFPGRTFRILERVSLDSTLRKKFSNGFANILTRNYPQTVEAIKKKTGLKEGGEKYLICARTKKEKMVVIAERLK